MKVLDHLTRGALCVVGVLCILCLISAPLAVAQTTFSSPPFPAAPAGLNTQGNASTNGSVLQLTSSGGDQVGSAWYVNNGTGNNNGAVSLVSGFNTTFVFQFTGQNVNSGSINYCSVPGSPSVGRGGADGIAFVVQNGSFSNNTKGSNAVAPNTGTGGEIGLKGLTNSVAVEFDTWYNSEYNDTCAKPKSPTSADQVTIESCAGGAANAVDHNAGCQFATVDLSAIATPIYIGDKNPHTVQISYAPPAVSGSCPIGSLLGASGCGTLTVTIDTQPVLTAPFNLAYITGLDNSEDAYVGFTGATGGAFETQVINSWSFSATGATTVTNPVPPGGTVDNQFNNTPGNVNGYSYDFSTISNGQENCPLGCDNTNIVSNNIQVTPGTWPQYVIGTPYATSVLPTRPGNGPTAPGSIFANACYGGSVPISSASDANCPVANNSGNTVTNFITVKDTFDQPAVLCTPDNFPNCKLPLLPGTTVALIDFHPADSSKDWNPDTDTGQGETNPACTDLTGNNNNGVVTPTLCYLPNSLDSVYGDQTTTRGSKPPKNATKLATAFGVPFPITSVFVSAAGCPSIGTDTPLNNSNEDQPGFGTSANANVWFNGACQLYFAVNPAKVPQAYTCPQGVPNNNTCNNFTPAPPAVLTYGLGTAPSGGDAAPLINPNLSSNTATWTTSGIPLTGLTSLFPGDGAAQAFHWSSIDTIGIQEKNIYLQTTGVHTDCDNPDSDPNLVPPCYNTRYFNSTVNIDSVSPTPPTCATIPAPNGNGWYNADVVITGCTVTDALSGVYSGTIAPATGGTITTGLPLPGAGATAYFNLNTTVGAGNANAKAYTGTAQFVDYAQNPSAALQEGPFMVDMAFPTIPSGVSLSPAGPYTVNQVVTATFSCADVGSGIASCTGAPLAPSTACSTTSGVTTCTVNTTTPGANQTFTASATDLAGNGPVNAIAHYTVNAGPDLQLCELPAPCATSRADKVKPGSVLLYFNWGANLSTSTTATNVTITQSFPTSVVGSKPLAIAGVISFKKGGTPPLIATGASCSSSADVNTQLTTVTCQIASLPASTNTTTTAAAVLLTLPISSKAPLGAFNINASINGTGDPNLSNNSVVDTVTVSK